MNTLKVSINPAILEWGIVRSGIPREKLEKKLPKINLWIAKQDRPTLKQLEDLSKTLHIPFGYFFLENPPKEQIPIPLFRTKNETPNSQFSTEFIDTLYEMQRRQIWLKEYLIESHYEPLPFICSCTLNDDPVQTADKIRKELKINDEWARHFTTWNDALLSLREKVEQANIFFVANGIVKNNTHRPLNVNEFRGFVLVDDYAPLIFVNNADCKAAQMFTIAHELAHLWIGESAAFDLRGMQPAQNAKEVFCDKVAAEFLVPAKILEERINDITSPDISTLISRLSREFKVSEIVIARRLLDCEHINKEQFFSFYDKYFEWQKEKTKDKGGGDYYQTQSVRVSKHFLQYVVQALNEGVLLYTDAYRLTGLNRKTFDNYIDRVLENI
ncbi:MAG TPA: ImmA/IrrE family metallo-endopeptidase [Candidatus Cloacimonas sp.]|nr:ImmA/IrrE family metallo-endopeptidase [Candidatus Cloacimonas sp.]